MLCNDRASLDLRETAKSALPDVPFCAFPERVHALLWRARRWRRRESTPRNSFATTPRDLAVLADNSAELFEHDESADFVTPPPRYDRVLGMATPNAAKNSIDRMMQAELENELRQAEDEFARGDFIELTIEELDRAIAAGVWPWPDGSSK